MKKTLFLLILSAVLVFGLYAQANTEQIFIEPTGREITIQKNTDFHTSMKIIESLSLQEERKNILNISSYSGGIPFQINRMGWREALRLITTTLDLVVEEKPGVIIISDRPDAESSLIKGTVEEYNIHDKMIRINATFLEVNRAWANEAGINWNTLFTGQVNGNVGFNSPGVNPGADGTVINLPPNTPDRNWKWDQTTISLDALLNFIETNNKGTVLARPTITVLNGQDGFVQVGEDFSVMQLDSAGNSTEKFFSTGIILNVRPTIIEEDGFEVIHLTTSVEKSSIQSISPPRILKNQANTSALLFDGEETVIGGLIDTSQQRDRTGVPVLKNLPWWALGFLFRYSTTTTKNSEMVVIIKAEIMPNAMDRIREREVIRDSFDQMKEDFRDIHEELLSKPKKDDDKNRDNEGGR
jgi:type IV pilus assembly protein PilQ